MTAHINFLVFIKTFKSSEYSADFIQEITNFGWQDNLNQILSYKLTKDEYHISQLNEVFYKMKRHFYDKPKFWLIHVPLLYSPKPVCRVYFSAILVRNSVKKLLRPFVARFLPFLIKDRTVR